MVAFIHGGRSGPKPAEVIRELELDGFCGANRSFSKIKISRAISYGIATLHGLFEILEFKGDRS
jgi:hypothetical protein